MGVNTKRDRQRWKQNTRDAAAHAAVVLTPGAEWHPLDDGGVPMPEYIPEQWDGVHVGLRLCEAFKTLSNMPNSGGLKKAMGYWPTYWHDWADLLWQQEMELQTKEDVARLQNRAKVQPSSQDVSRMEIAIVWPARYLANAVHLSRTVLRIAVLRARDYDLQRIADKMKRDPKALRAVNRAGLDAIASGLRRDHVRVF